MITFSKCVARLLAVGLVVSLATLAQAPPLDPAGIKAKVQEALNARKLGNEAYGKDNAEEGKKQFDLSSRLLREARDAYIAIHAGESDDLTLLLDYSAALTETADYDLAESALLRAAKLAPDDAAVWLKLGQAQAALGPKSESDAILSLRKAAAIEPATTSTTEAYASLGSLYQQAGLYEFARETYAKALEKDPNHLGTKLAIAALDAREGQMVKAEAAFDSIENLSPETGPYIKQTLGTALEQFNQSRRWIDDTAEMHFAYAELLVRVGRLEDSYLPLNRSLRLDDQNYVVWNLMGSVTRAMNRLRGSREAFMRSLELNPDQPRTREALAELDKIEAEKPGSTTFAPGTAANPASAPATPAAPDQSAPPTPAAAASTPDAAPAPAPAATPSEPAQPASPAPAPAPETPPAAPAPAAP